MEEITMQTMDLKIRKFKEFMDDFNKMFESGHLSVNMWKTQRGQLKAANLELEEKNRKAEELLNQTVSAMEKIKADAMEFEQRKRADALVLYSKAHAKYKEFERHLEEADKKRLKNELKELEAVA